MAPEGPTPETPETLIFPTLEDYYEYAAGNPDVYADAETAYPSVDELYGFAQLDPRKPLGDLAAMHAALVIASAAADEPRDAPSPVTSGQALSWDTFWGDGRVTEIEPQAPRPVPLEHQPASQARLGGTPLGSVALKRVAAHIHRQPHAVL